MSKMMIHLIIFFSVHANAKITLYTDRPLDAVVEAYTEETGIEIEVVAKPWPHLRQQIIDEGKDSPADIYVLKDVVYINELMQRDLLAKHGSQLAHDLVDPSMVSDFYTALTFRIRTLIYNNKVDVSSINTYMDLANSEHVGKLCLRTSRSPYNIALFAGLIKSYGSAATFDLLDGWLNNMVDPSSVFPNDWSILDSLANYSHENKHACQLGVNSSYYISRFLTNNPEAPLKMKVLTMKDGGVSTNGNVAGLSQNTQNHNEARNFLEFMLQPNVQNYFARFFHDFPANRNVEYPGLLSQWSDLPLTSIPWESLHETTDEAIELFQILDYQ